MSGSADVMFWGWLVKIKRVYPGSDGVAAWFFRQLGHLHHSDPLRPGPRAAVSITAPECGKRGRQPTTTDNRAYNPGSGECQLR